MEDVRIYDFEFNLLHIEHDIYSCNWTLQENDIGTFEMHFSLKSRLAAVLAEHTYLVAVQGDKQAVVTGRQLNTEGVLYGKTCNWLLTRFCVGEDVDTDALFDAGTISSKDAQSLCAFFITLGLSRVSDFSFSENEEDSFGEVSVKGQAGDSVFSLVQNALSQDGGGHRVFFDADRHLWVFSVTKGRSLPAVLSDENKNAYETEFTADLQGLFTGGYYSHAMEDMGEWDAVNNSPFLSNGRPENYAKGYRAVISGEDGTTSYTRFGITFSDGDYLVCTDPAGTWQKGEKIESFLVHLPSSLSGIYAWETFLDGENEEEAVRDLAEKKAEEQLLLKTRNFLYGRDYRLGDRVLVQFQKGAARSAKERRITGVNLWYEAGDIGQQPIFEEESDL